MLKRNTPLARRTPLKRGGRLPRMSKRRSKESPIYTQRARQFLRDHPICEVWCKEHGFRWVSPFRYESHGPTIVLHSSHEALLAMGAPRSEEIHHTAGRMGGNYLNEHTWLAVCRANHDRIHRNGKAARAAGLMR